MPDNVVYYELEDGTADGFVAPYHERGLRFEPADVVLGKIQDAVEPSIRAAQAVLSKVRELAPDEAQITFGIAVAGETSWLVAKGSAEASFQVTLAWKGGPKDAGAPQPG